jgi:diguanylate cyclase (GGDEF)-like protein
MNNEIIELLKDKFISTLQNTSLDKEERDKILSSFLSIIKKLSTNFKEALNSIYDGIVVVDENNLIKEANEVFLKWINKTKEEILNKNFNLFLTKGRFFYIKNNELIPISIKKQEFEVEGKKFKRYILLNIRERVLFEEKLKNILRLYKVLSHINELLVRAVDRVKVFKDACKIIVEDGGFDFAWIGEVEKDVIKPIAYYGKHEDFKTFLKNNQFKKEPAFFEKIKEANYILENELENEESYFQHKITIPIFKEKNSISAITSHDEIVAVLCVYYKGKIFEEEEIELLKQIAHDIGFGIVALNRKEDINYFTYYDVLTKLPNRRYFFEDLEKILEMHQSKNKTGALVLIDINHFNIINSTIGFWAGDYVLVEISKKLKNIISPKDLIARTGSDEFGIFFSNISSKEEVIYKISNALDMFEIVFFIEDKKFIVTLSAGIAFFPYDGNNKETLFSAAESALTAAKKKGKGIVLYESSMKKSSYERIKTESALVDAIKHDEFEVFYQPIIDLNTKKVGMCEALLRWKSKNGYVSPVKFIPYLESLGLIKEVGMIVMDKVFSFIKQQNIKIPVSINVSAKQITKNFYNEVITLIDKHQVDTSYIIFEVTESVLMENMDVVVENIKKLNEIGIKFEIDDFGTGYSSLAYLKKLPIISLKIDRTFIKETPYNEEDVSITKAIISMAHSLGKKVIAEGVEKIEQLQFLREQKCDYIQGFIFAKPMPQDDFLEYLNNFNYEKVINENNISDN